MSECLIPAFVNNIPTIDPLPDFPIVCPVVFPPALAIPDIPLPPCVDGINITSSGLEVNISMGDVGSDPKGSGTFTVTPNQCSFDLAGSITLVIPTASSGGGGGGGGGVEGCPPTEDGIPQIRNADGVCVPAYSCSTPGKFNNLKANELLLPCTASSLGDGKILLDDTGIYTNLEGVNMSMSSFGLILADDPQSGPGTSIKGMEMIMAADVASPIVGMFLTNKQLLFEFSDGSIAVDNDEGLISDSSRSIKVIEVGCCKDGAPAKRLVLASEAYDPS